MNFGKGCSSLLSFSIFHQAINKQNQICNKGNPDGKTNQSNPNIPFRIGRWKNQLINSEKHEKIPPSTKDKKTRLECRAVDDFAPNLPTRYPDMASSVVVINSNICSNPLSHGLSKTNKRHQNPPGPLMRLPRQRPNPSLP
ncbi:hypothetical protein Veis_3890 [Verminephrobacter eiseniae EF01-2]|uniref:Uncharacterized protein n=1 Tax=Verminephrobacter eiseniae (strain EF01-2) TaxID=391735 RepID=A1WPP0_VEREI|nr:hypothetical protein Veis_3890 [Verminephrobacter eiseniae EF01-2]